MAEKQHLEKYHVLAKIHGNVASNTSISSLSKYDIHTTCFSDFNFTLGGEEIDRKKVPLGIFVKIWIWRI